jgi:60 kDa SS-A/Ro ribonucleoprotein
MSYLKQYSTRSTPQAEPIPGAGQMPNSAGGFAWAVDDWTRLRRFLILGSEGGSYYAGERELTRENADAVVRCLKADGARTVAEIVAVSRDARAPKNDPALFALAACAGLGDEATRRTALDSLPAVCRTGTHLFQFARFVEGFRGWGRSLRRAVGRWYTVQEPGALAYQAVKYRRRDGVSHRDLLRLAHPGSSVSAGNPELEVSGEHAALFDWIVRGGRSDGLPRIVDGFVRAQAAPSARESAELIREYRLPREAVSPEHLGSPEVWEALLQDMPMGAMIRNLAVMTRVGVLAPGSAASARVLEALGDVERLRKARVHPMSVLVAQRTYAAGHGVRGRGEWSPVAQVLDAAFYAAFGSIESAGKRLMLALDVSGSMDAGQVAGAVGLTPRDASAAMALITAASEPSHEVVGFFAGEGGVDFGQGQSTRFASWRSGLTPLSISPHQRLDDVIRTVSGLPFGGTDCALPMLYALQREREIDTFVIYTDSETWAGDIHPVQALRQYREQSGISASLVVVGMVSNGFSIADPEDQGMLDVVGFDTATPQLISDFARGTL